MREPPPFEVRLDRFGVRCAAVAIAAVSGRAGSTAAARAGENVASVVAVAAGPAMAMLAAGRWLVCVPGGVLACRDRGWSFAPQSGGGRDRAGLSVQRRGLAPDRHCLRCTLCPSPRPIAPAARAAPPAE